MQLRRLPSRPGHVRGTTRDESIPAVEVVGPVHPVAVRAPRSEPLHLDVPELERAVDLGVQVDQERAAPGRRER